MEVAPQMRPTGRFAQARHATRFRHVQLSIAFVTIRLKDPTRISQMAQDVPLLPVRCKPIDSTGLAYRLHGADRSP